MPKRLIIAALAAIAASLVLASVSSAAVTFGSRLIDNPGTSMCNNTSGDPGTINGQCTMVMFIAPSAPAGDPVNQGAPISGVITKFRIKAVGEGGPATATFRLANITPDATGDSAIATSAGTGPTIQIPADTGGDAPITQVGARLPVTAGQHIAVDGSANLDALHVSDGAKWTYIYAPPLVDGQGGRDSTLVTEELLVQADIEPDADHDGFGDETQDQCPTQASTQGPCDTTAPSVSGLRVNTKTLKVSYTLSEGSTASLSLAKATTGRKVNGKCVRTTKRNHKRRHCTRFVAVGRAINAPGAAGANSLSLPKVHGRKLGAGRYKLTLTVTDVAGNKATFTKSFTIKPKPKKHKKH